MDEVLQANVFFFISSVAAILFTLFLCIALYHVIKLLRSLRNIVERVEHGSEVLAEDIDHIRSFVLEGSLVSQVISFFLGRKAKQGGARSKKRKVSISEE